MDWKYRYPGCSWVLSSLYQGADATKNDGVYSRFFTAFDANGRYSVKIWALGGVTSDRQRAAPPKNRAMYIDGWIEDGK
jgi:calcium-activated chloride channel regulator 1